MRTQPPNDILNTPPAGTAPLLLILSGVAWGLWYFGMNRVSWGEPGTAAYSRYEIYNRIPPAVLLLLLASTQYARRLLLGSLGRSGSAGVRRGGHPADGLAPGGRGSIGGRFVGRGGAAGVLRGSRALRVGLRPHRL